MNNQCDFLVPTIPPLSEFVPDINYEEEDTKEVDEHKMGSRNNVENTMDIIAMVKGGDDGLAASVYQCSQTKKKLIAAESSSSLNSERASKKRTRTISEDIHHDVQQPSKCTKIPKGKGDSIAAIVEKTNRVLCSEEGCKNKAQGGGICLKHGGKPSLYS